VELFANYKRDELASVTPEMALKHPTWKMGPKITIDSATMMNKGFELIEAHYLFDWPVERMEVLLHDESEVHSALLLEGWELILPTSNKRPTCTARSAYALYEAQKTLRSRT
jgi:1-deoxy-D-xylulose-5-phosphate reductoisomerase